MSKYIEYKPIMEELEKEVKLADDWKTAHEIANVVKYAPTIDIDRPQGEWIFCREFVEDTPFTGYRCSNCNYWKSMGAWNYCPNCGARMKGADDE